MADEGQLVALETYASAGEMPHLTNAVSDIRIARGATVVHYGLQLEGASFHFGAVRARIGKDARFTSHNVVSGGAHTRNDTTGSLDGEGAHCTLNGLMLIRGTQHVDNFTRLEHRMPRCDSHELYKGVLDGRASGVFTGRIHVFEDAQKTDAYQASANLLLTDTEANIVGWLDHTKQRWHRWERVGKLRFSSPVAVAKRGETVYVADSGLGAVLEALIDQSREAPLPGTDLPSDVTLPDSQVFREATARDIFSAIGEFANISIVFDPTYRDQTVSVDIREASLDQALTSITTATRTFWRVTAPRTVTVFPDTQAKRREYEEEIVRTFYLSNADLKETIDILRIVVDARRIAAMTATNAITIKDTPERVTAAGRIISAIDVIRSSPRQISIACRAFRTCRSRGYGSAATADSSVWPFPPTGCHVIICLSELHFIAQISERP